MKQGLVPAPGAVVIHSFFTPVLIQYFHLLHPVLNTGDMAMNKMDKDITLLKLMLQPEWGYRH